MRRYDVFATSGSTRYMIGRYAADDPEAAILAARAKIAELEPQLLTWDFSAVEVY